MHAGSDAGALLHPEFAVYGAANAALVNVSNALSKDYGAAGVRFNAVSRGLRANARDGRPARVADR